MEISLGGSLGQAQGRLFRGPNVLEVIDNGDHDKEGYLKKARGFTRIALTTTILGESTEAVYVSVGVTRGELILVGERYIYAVASATENIVGASLIRRGPTMCGNYESGVVHVAGF